MPKLKTHKGTKRRIHITGSGRFMRMKGHRSHNRRKKSSSALGLMDETLPVDNGWKKRLKRLLPYGLR